MLDTISSDAAFDVSGRDPLALDAVFRGLPSTNLRRDTGQLIDILNRTELEVVAACAPTMDVRDALASVRDLGMLAASLRRHGVEPREVVPSVERALLALGNRTDMAPRDTVFHYGPWNPRGDRERTFTADDNERGLIEATRIASARLERSVEYCRRLVGTPPESPEFVQIAAECATHLDGLIEAILHTRSCVCPIFFAQTLRPYFEPIQLGEAAFAGAAAAPLSVGLIDHLLWSSDCDDADYRSFQEHGIRYNIPSMRRLYDERLGQQSLVTIVASRRDDPALYRTCADALDGIFVQVLGFRGRHMTVAKGAYDTSIRKYEVGSAGYGLDTLQMILRLTKEARRGLQKNACELDPCTT